MDVRNLQKHHPLLLEYLHDNGYSRCHIQWMRRCIKLVLNEGSSPEIDSYEQLYREEVQRRGYKDAAPVRKTLKSVLGCVKRFDLKGIYPQPNMPHGFLAPIKKYDLLNDEYKSVIDYYEQAVKLGSKVDRTVYTERQAGILFLLHLQSVGAHSFMDTTERHVLDFFYNGEKIIRSKAYKEKIIPVLKATIPLHGEPVKKLLTFFPSIPKSYRNYPFLTHSESEKLRNLLEEENSQLTLLDKAIAAIAYYTGLRGTDILSLSPENIDWEHDMIHLAQSKTGIELTIPMNAIVGNAIWDYLLYERPNSKEKTIFVNWLRPYNKISVTWDHLKNVFNEAGVRKDGGRTGVRIFRHHLATALLKNRVSPPVISSILGHTSPESITPYIDADLDHLRECSLSIEDYPVPQKLFEL